MVISYQSTILAHTALGPFPCVDLQKHSIQGTQALFLQLSVEARSLRREPIAGDWRILIQASYFAALHALDTELTDKATRCWLDITTLHQNG